MLAFYMPQGNEDKRKDYSQEDLNNPMAVKEIFDYCQILEGYVTYRGWLTLLKTYGYEKLYEINKESGWLAGDTIEAFQKELDWEIRMAKETEYDTCCRE